MRLISVVVVDDEPLMPRLFRRNMQNALAHLNTELPADARVELAFQAFASPEEALPWLAKNRPDHIISDYAMPGMNGVQFFRAVRELFGKNMPRWTFVSSSFGEYELDQTVLEHGLGKLEKPFGNAAIEELLVLTWWHVVNQSRA